MRIATVSAGARYRLMLTEAADARLETLGAVTHVKGDTKAAPPRRRRCCAAPTPS